MLCSPWYSCCCHFYCLRKYFCLKSLTSKVNVQTMNTVQRSRFGENKKERREKEKLFQKGGNLVKFSEFLHTGALVGD